MHADKRRLKLSLRENHLQNANRSLRFPQESALSAFIRVHLRFNISL